MKKNIARITLSSALLLGTLSLVSAQTTSNEASAPVVGSIQVPSTESTYQSLAKVSMDEAVKAAQTHLGVSTAASSASLDTQNGYLVWEVQIGDQEVIVDAGNAAILQSGTAEQDMNDQGNDQEMNDQDNDQESGQDEMNDTGSQNDSETNDNEGGAEDGN